jgi:3',5'-cyclic AMP phosphodiesterase CpdA
MNRLLGLGAAVAVFIAAAALSLSQSSTSPSAKSGELRVEVEDRNPWTNLKLNNDSREFRFAIVSDRTGGHRAGIFTKAIERLNLMQPEFVVSVGDLIEGYTEDREKMTDQWKEFNGYIGKLQMPFFYVPGNHDISNPVMEKEWTRTLGRRYYHFVYRNVLFLMLDSEDPPEKGKDAPKNPVRISDEQIAYIKKTLDANKDVRWTIVALHKPLWFALETEKSRWLDIEKLLAGRDYTVFAGHVHRYLKSVRQGMNYYMLATTGGGSKLRGPRYGEFDHLTWVTVKKDGPVIANLMLDGIVSDTLQVADTDEKGVPTKNRKPVHTATVKVVYKGKPVPNAVVVFYTHDAKAKKYNRISDALTEEDGTSAMSTYTAFDGVPEGEYTVTITWQEPRFDETGKPTPNKLPAKYGKTAETPLKAVIKAGEKNVLTFELE